MLPALSPQRNAPHSSESDADRQRYRQVYKLYSGHPLRQIQIIAWFVAALALLVTAGFFIIKGVLALVHLSLLSALWFLVGSSILAALAMFTFRIGQHSRDSGPLIYEAQLQQKTANSDKTAKGKDISGSIVYLVHLDIQRAYEIKADGSAEIIVQHQGSRQVEVPLNLYNRLPEDGHVALIASPSGAVFAQLDEVV